MERALLILVLVLVGATTLPRAVELIKQRVVRVLRVADPIHDTGRPRVCVAEPGSTCQ